MATVDIKGLTVDFRHSWC